MPRFEEIIRILKGYFGDPIKDETKDPLSELIFTILSQNTTDKNRDRAYENLRGRFPNWEDVLKADVSDVEGAIRIGGLGAQKSRRIKAILEEIYTERGELRLDYLNDLKTSRARERLLQFKGVGPKTAAIVLLFSLDRPAFPVDTHIMRVGGRLGFFPKSIDPEGAQGVMEGLVKEEEYYPFHINLISLGREFCKPKNPRCETCPVLEFCPGSNFTLR